MATDKDQLHALLADYVEGSLSEQQIDEAEAYLAANPGVRSVVDKLMVDSEALRALPPVRSPVDYSEDIRGAAERDLLLSDAPEPGKRPLSGPTFALAALLFVTLGLGGSAYWILTHRPSTNFDFASTVGRTSAPTTAPDESKAATRADASVKDDAMFAAVTPKPAVTPAREREATEAMKPAAATPDLQVMTARAEDAMAKRGPIPAAPATPGEAAEHRVALGADAARDRTLADALAGGGWPRELEVPASVQAIVEAAPVEGGRPAMAVVVSDVAAVEAMRKLVRDNVALEQQAQNVFEKVSNAKVLAATMPIDLGPLVATDVPVELAGRIRAAVAADRTATIYDIASARSAGTADREAASQAPPQQNALQQSAMRQELSGVLNGQVAAKSSAAASRPANVDVFVVLVPTSAPTTLPAE